MEKLGIDTKIMIAQAVNFVVLFFLFSRFVYKPFLSMLKKEQTQKADAEKALTFASKKEAEITALEMRLKDKYEKEGKERYAVMKKDVENAKKAILDQAHKEAEQVRSRNMKLIDAEREKMLAEVKKEAYQLAEKLVEKAASETMSADLHKKISADIIKRLPKIKA